MNAPPPVQRRRLVLDSCASSSFPSCPCQRCVVTPDGASSPAAAHPTGLSAAEETRAPSSLLGLRLCNCRAVGGKQSLDQGVGVGCTCSCLRRVVSLTGRRGRSHGVLGGRSRRGLALRSALRSALFPLALDWKGTCCLAGCRTGGRSCPSPTPSLCDAALCRRRRIPGGERMLRSPKLQATKRPPPSAPAESLSRSADSGSLSSPKTRRVRS